MNQPHRAVAVESEAQMLPAVREWLHCHTIESANWTATELADAKGTTRISVVLPARDEDRTVGRIVTTIRRELMDSVPLVDELVVVDSGSSDDTASVAAAAGATVVAQDAVLPHLGCRTGKGEALWKSLAVTTGEVIVFIDADVENFAPRFVTGLLGPLLVDPGVGYVKAAYRRPLLTPNGALPTAGGRVTELVARPLINLHWPLLAGFRQPLAGEYAGRREAFERVPFAAGYGVEFGLLVDLLELLGLPGLAQVELGIRYHSHQPTPALGRMAGQIMHTAWTRLRRRGSAPDGEPPAATLTQFRYNGGGYDVIESDVGVPDRPPMMSVAAYHACRFAALSRGGHP